MKKKRTTYQEVQHNVMEVAEHSVAIRELLKRFPDVLTVEDATVDKMLVVTAGDVRKAVPKSPSACAVAQCAKRQHLGGMIGRVFAFLVNGTAVTRYQLMKDAQVRTAMFDDRGTTSTGPIMLNAPSPSQRLGRMGQRTRIHATSSQRRRPASKDGRHAHDRAERQRKIVSTHGFRSWSQA